MASRLVTSRQREYILASHDIALDFLAAIVLRQVRKVDLISVSDSWGVEAAVHSPLPCAHPPLMWPSTPLLSQSCPQLLPHRAEGPIFLVSFFLSLQFH